MPADSALEVGAVNAVELITATAIPSALPEMAVCMYWTICGTADVAEPPHFGLGMPSSAAASAKPYWVGTKNGFVVTWLTNQKFHGGVFGKSPATAAALELELAPAWLVPFDAEHAASRADAAAVALTRPVPLSRTRRVWPSFMLRISMASSTLGSIFFFISKPPDGFLGAACCPPLPYWID